MAAKKPASRQIPHPLYRLALPMKGRVDGETAQRVAEALEDMAVSVFLHNREATDGDDWTVTLTTFGPPDTAEVTRRLQQLEKTLKLRGLAAKPLKPAKLPEKNWLRHVHENFPPIKVGRFFIRGSHFKGKTPKGLAPLHIDAATAFGSGEHETTKSCLLALEGLAKKHSFENALDMGCGSGILAIGVTKIWKGCKTTAIDIDPESITVTKRHAKMNKAKLQTQAGDGYAAPLVRKNGPYDLVVANILAEPLIMMAPACRRVTAKGGFCVLSGLLKRQAAAVSKAYEKQGFRRIRVLALGDWRALVFRLGA